MQAAVRAFFVSTLAFAAAAAGAQDAAPKTVSIHLDPSKTQITFAAGLLHRVHGTFALKTGLFALDTASGVAQGEILADAASEKSSNKDLDNQIQKTTLETGTYPGISFHPEKVAGSLPSADGETHLKVQGTLTIHGGDHPLSVDVDAVRKGSDIQISTGFAVPYVAWGLKEASVFLMHDHTVHVTITAHGVIEAAHAGE